MNSKQTAGRNIAVLAAAQALGGASPPIVMSLGGLVGLQLASNPAWATFPVSLFGLGLAFGTLPAAAMMRRWGRRAGYVLGALNPHSPSKSLILLSGSQYFRYKSWC